MSEASRYQYVSAGFAPVRMPDGSFRLAQFSGAPSEVDQQIRDRAAALGGRPVTREDDPGFADWDCA